MVSPIISDVNQFVLEHVARYRLTTAHALSKTGVSVVTTVAQATDKLEELVSSGDLQASLLCPESGAQEKYFYLTARSATHLGHDLTWSQPIKRDMRIECVAKLLFCVSGKRFRQPLMKGEFVQQFNSLWFPGQPVQYYLEPTDHRPTRLAFFKIDTDGEGRWDRLIDSCGRFLRQRLKSEGVAPQYRIRVAAFAKLVAQGQFQFTVLTALPDKKRAIEIELERRQLAGQHVPPIEVHVVDGLLDLIYPPVVDRLLA